MAQYVFRKNIWNFDPTSIAGCTLWLDGADLSSITLSGSNVTQWRDKSGNGRNAVPTTGAFQYATTFNGSYPSIFGANTGGNGLIASISSFPLLNPSNVFAVFRNTGLNSGTNSFPYLFNITSASNRAYAYCYNQTTTPGLMRISAGSGSADSATNVNTTVSQVFSMQMGASSTLTYQNGTLASTSGITGASLTSTITIGGFTTSNAWTGHLCEFIINTNNITSSERQQIEGYLAWKWGLQASLPSTHPYSNTYSVVRPFLRAFQPTDLPTSCLLWFDGGDATTLTLSGSNVTTWRDKSGTANNFTFSGNFPTYNATTGFLGMIGLGNYGTTTTPITLSSPTASTIFTVAVPTFPNNVGTYYSVNFRSGLSAPNFYHSLCARHSLNAYYIERNPNGNYQFIGQGSFSANAISSNGTSVSYTTNTGIPADTLTTGTSIAITSTPGLTSTMSISTISGAAGVVTVTFATSHPFSVGQHIAISGVSVNGYNTVNSGGSPAASSLNNAIMTVVASVPNSTSITYANTTTASASGGTVVGTYDGVYAASSYNSGTGVVAYPNTLTATSAASLTITGATGNGTLATVTFTNPVAGTPILFAPGQMLSITGVNPSSYNSSNGDSKVISATSNTVTYTRGTSATYVSGGTIRSTISFPQTLNSYTWITSSSRSDATNLTFSTSGNPVSNTSTSNSNTGTHTFSVNSAMTVNIGEIIMYDGALSTQNRQRVEGYLLWKWGSQRVVQSGSYTTVSNTHPFYRFPTPNVTPFSPFINSGLIGWFDASDSTTVSGSGTSGFSWLDKAGVVTSARNSSGFPTYSLASVNGLNAVTCTTNTQSIRINAGASSLYNFSGTGQISAFFVVKPVTTGQSSIADINGFTRFSVYWTPSTPSIAFSLLGASSPTITGVSGITGTFLVAITSAGTSSTGSLLLNGTSVGTITTGTGTYSFLQPALQRDNSETCQFCEFITYNTLLTSTQRQQVEGYLAWKWGLQNSLPTTHPYYKIRP